MTRPRRPIGDRLWEKVDVGHPAGCWMWTGAKKGLGYGCLFSHMVGKRAVTVQAHRVAYELLRGPIPDGMPLDHLCRVKLCVNPDHLEPVTHRENVLRAFGPPGKRAAQRECKRGHSLSGNNVRIEKTGSRRCLACQRQIRAEKRAAA